MTFPPLKKYFWYRMKEPSATSAPGYRLTYEDALLLLGSVTCELVCLT